jgi:cystathionine beta-lyase
MKDNTIVTHAGNRPFENEGIINPPVYHASTVLSPTFDALLDKANAKVRYGRRGTPTTFALEDAMSELEHAHGTVLAPSGKAAITMTLSALVEPGDHILMTDTSYAPTRGFANSFLQRFGVETEFYDPLIGADIKKMLRPNTRLIWTESPGSQTFEIQDIPAITAVAREAGVLTIMDNTWAGGYFYKPLDHGVDISVQAATKYIVGHSDVMMGTIACNEATFDQVKASSENFGICTGPDDVYLTLRGLRTIGARMPMHHQNALQVAEWLQQRPEVTRVMYPALPQDPNHAIWSRDFTGASGLFGFVINTADHKKIAAFLDDLKLYGMGSSWGGYESLMLPSWPNKNRSATRWDVGGQTMRIHVGLEDVSDLIEDLDAGFDRLNKAY